MITVEQETKDHNTGYIAGFTLRSFRAASEILDTIKTYQVVFRLFLGVEFLQLLYFSISPRLIKIYSLNVFRYLAYMTSFVQFGGAWTDGDQSTQDVALYTMFAIVFTAVVILLSLPLWMVGQKQPLSTIANVSIKISAFYFMLFESIILLPAAQIAYYSLICMPSVQYYKGNLL